MLKIEMIKLFEDNAIWNKGARIQKKKKSNTEELWYRGPQHAVITPALGPFQQGKTVFMILSHLPLIRDYTCKIEVY